MHLNTKKKFQNYLVSDLQEILTRNHFDLNKFQGRTVLIAGANGFIGSWLTALFLYSKQELNLNFEVGVICRDLKKFHQKFTIKQKEVSFFHEFDLNLTESIQKKINENYDLVFNCASSANYAKHLANEKVTENLIALIHSERNKPNFINMSSGAVYGEKSSTRALILERSSLPSSISHLSQYTRDKIDSEKVVSRESALNRINGANARLFTFYGPHFPLDSYYAIGNFMQDAVKQTRIVVKGNPETVRSYLYPTDLISAILRLSINPTLEIIHIGSKHGISMGDLAKLISTSFGSSEIQFLESEDNANFYVPDTSNSERHLGIYETVNLDEGLARWARWLF
jgi:dTDP-glucose 4,6-dehydratase